MRMFWRFFRGWQRGSLITTKKYDGKWEWPLFSYNFKLEQPIIGVIVDRRWHWFGIINRGWGSEGYGYYNKNGDWQEEISWSMKRWGWEYQVLIEGELKWLWHGEFLVIDQI
jgi:hypothetical protein